MQPTLLHSIQNNSFRNINNHIHLPKTYYLKSNHSKDISQLNIVNVSRYNGTYWKKDQTPEKIAN